MGLQDRPVCFECDRPIRHSPVYEAPCGHDGCSSAVFHGTCLMRWRERRAAAEAWLREHQEHGARVVAGLFVACSCSPGSGG